MERPRPPERRAGPRGRGCECERGTRGRSTNGSASPSVSREDWRPDGRQSSEMELLEEVVPLVVDEDERGEVDHVDLPDRLHAELGEVDALDLLDVLLGEQRGRAADRTEVEAAVLL